MSSIEVSRLRPGLLVSLKTSIQGGVSYDKTVIDADHMTETGARVERWETERVVANPQEHEAARKARSRARQTIVSVCAQSAFGLLCPEDRREELERAVAEARAVAEEFNNSAVDSRIRIYVIAGRVSADDTEAVRAISSEVRGLMAAMESGIRDLDAAKIRDAAKRARSVGQMLSPRAQERVKVAVDAARDAARTISKAGEAAAIEIDATAIQKIANSRTAFLDLDDMPSQAVDAQGPSTRVIDLDTAIQGAGASAVPTERPMPQLDL